MPVFKGVEVWIEDSQHRKIQHQEVTIDLVDNRTVAVKTEMFRDELYTVYCLSPVSVFCDVFVITSSSIRKHAARFCLNKAVTKSKGVLGSSENHTVGRFQEHGLRTPKKQFRQGKLGSVEVEIRRVDEIIKGEPREEPNGANGDEGVVADVSMIDDFAQLPWLLFRFDIGVKELPPEVPASVAKCIERPVARRTLRDHLDHRRVAKGSRSGGSMTEGSSKSSNEPSRETSYEHLPDFKRHHRHDGSVGVDENQAHGLDQLQKDYHKAEAEERMLLRVLQQRLQAKKTRNKELRRLLGGHP